MRRSRGRAPILPPLPVTENWSDFDPELETANYADPELGSDHGTSEGNPF